MWCGMDRNFFVLWENAQLEIFDGAYSAARKATARLWKGARYFTRSPPQVSSSWLLLSSMSNLRCGQQYGSDLDSLDCVCAVIVAVCPCL